MPAPSIRTASQADLPSVLALWERSGGPPGATDSLEALSLLLAADPEALLLAESRGSVVGTLIAGWDGWRGCFYRLAVEQDRRREGIAAALLREGERRLARRGAARLTAIVADDDPAAIGFWEGAGYERQRDRTRFVSRPR